MNKPLTINDVDELSGRQFEFFTGKLLKKLNYHHIKVTRASGDHGLDVLATDRIGRRIGIQCKLVAPHACIGFGAIQETFTGKALYHTNVGIVLTNGRLNKNAVKSANKLHIKYWSRNTLRELLDITNNIVKPKHKPKHHKHKKHKYYKKSVIISKKYVYSSKKHYRIKYKLDNPIIYKGFSIIANGIGGHKRFKYALTYLKNNGFPNMKYANLYQTYRHALKRSRSLRLSENTYRNKVNQNRKNKYEKRLKYQHNRRLIKKHKYHKLLIQVQSLTHTISILKDNNNKLKKRVRYLNRQNN